MILNEASSGEATPLAIGSVALPDGRALGWTAWGAEDGATVIGQPHLGVTGRRALAVDVARFTEAGIRIVFVCRAGMRPSDRHEGRTADDDADDMLAVMDAFGVDRADLLGECGGTGAVLSLAARWPERVRGVALVSAMAPLAGPEADRYINARLRQMRRWLKYAPVARWVARNQVAAYRKDPVAYLERGWRALPAPDRVYVEDPVRRRYGQAQMTEFSRTPEPWFDEWRSIVGPWTVDLSAITAQVMILHGEQDQTAPVAMARWMAERMPSAELRLEPDRGHAIAPDRLAAALAELVAPAHS